MEPVRSGFEKLVARGETEVDEWIQTGLSQKPRAQEAAEKIADLLESSIASRGVASLVVAGDIDMAAAQKLVEKWFGEVPGPEAAAVKIASGHGVPDMEGYDPAPVTPSCS